MAGFGDPLQSEIRAARNAIRREEIALLCLGPKGQYFEGDDWERRADALDRNPVAYLRGVQPQHSSSSEATKTA